MLTLPRSARLSFWSSTGLKFKGKYRSSWSSSSRGRVQHRRTHRCHCYCWSCRNAGGLSAFQPRRPVPSLHWFHWWPSSPGVPRAGGCRWRRWTNIRGTMFQIRRRSEEAAAAAEGKRVFWMSHPSSKQWAAVTTQQGEMREPPQRKPWPKIAAIQGCDSTSAKEPFTILLALRSDLSPHDSSAKTPGMSSETRGVKEKPKPTPRAAPNYLYPVQQVVGVRLFWGLLWSRRRDQNTAPHETLTCFHFQSGLHMGTAQKSLAILLPFRT